MNDQSSPTQGNPQPEFRWCEPIDAKNIDPELPPLTAVRESLPIGFIELRSSLPETIAEADNSFVLSILEQKAPTALTAQEAKDAILSQCYFRAARQLYSSMTEDERYRCRLLQGIFYDTTPIPSFLNNAIAMIGHFRCEFGEVRIRHAEVLLRRWVVIGLETGNELQTGEKLTRLMLSQAVFRDRSSKILVNSLIEERVKRISKSSFKVKSHAGLLRVFHPLLACNEDGLNRVSENYPYHLEMRRLIMLHRMTHFEWRTAETIAGVPIQIVLDYLGVRLVVLSDEELYRCFTFALRRYWADYKSLVEEAFEVAEPVATGFGNACQTVSSDDLQATFALPLSDQDISMGFMYNPAVKFEFKPRFCAYSKNTGKEMRTARLQKEYGELRR